MLTSGFESGSERSERPWFKSGPTHFPTHVHCRLQPLFVGVDCLTADTIEGDHGVLLTTDRMEADAFEAAVTAVGRLLVDA
ncbi:hypothetical protein SAMN04487949_2716 [Halogranum gelatinilyticum]|uniref:Uncharacterized protein n=1 Tax=Halogranum gelatinilyticum TaxID=660521 RepID=A0A1G9WDK0_9EURY|nr:hypothetical protein SAMN04487949_2716 [Halogranum gelatinilyticum]